MSDDVKTALHRYLRVGREALLWKLEGLSEYDVRRPLVPTGTNLLGLLKHVAAVEAGYLGLVFGRPFPGPTPWDDDDEVADLWATAEEDRDELIVQAQAMWRHADATIEALPLEAVGRVPWWGDDGEVSLHLVLVHVATEVHRHAGHADVLRELLDGAAGLRPEAPNLPDADAGWWQRHRARVEQAARSAGARDGSAPIDATPSS